ncbi:MAG: antitoxin family protein [Blastocatellia bacterium]
MSITIEAIYEAGLLRPLEPLVALGERAIVKLTIEPQDSGDITRPSRYLAEVLRRIDQRREEIFRRRGNLEDSAALIREGREQELE